MFLSTRILSMGISTHNLKKDKGSTSPGTSIRKQNIQAKEVYSQTEAPVKSSKNARKMCSIKTQQH